MNLRFNPIIKSQLSASAKYSYGRLPNALCPIREISLRTMKVKRSNQQYKLEILAMAKKISKLTRTTLDNDRILWAIQQNDVPQLRRLLATHLRCGHSAKSFVQKIKLASDKKNSSDGMFRRKFIQRGKKIKGELTDEYKNILKMSLLCWKLGCGKLCHTNNFVNGGLSLRQVQRRISDHTLPSYNMMLTNAINQKGKQAIRKNIQALLGDGLHHFLPREKVIVVVMTDGVAVDERLRLDTKVVPHQITGLCRHCADTDFNEFLDFEKVASKFPKEIHHAKEMEVICLGFIHRNKTTIFPVVASPSCKKDDKIEESTDVIQFLMETLVNEYKCLGGVQKIGPLGTLVSDGAAHFRKGIGKLLSGDLPPEIRSVYGNGKCHLFNLVGNEMGTTNAVDLDHLGKRTRARIKTLIGIKISRHTFHKVDIAQFLSRSGIVSSPEEAEILLNPEDSMDVTEMVNCLKAIGKLSTTPYDSYPLQWRSNDTSLTQHQEMKLLATVIKCMVVLIVGHTGDYKGKEGKHLSVSELLKVASMLSHLLFVIIRHNKNGSKFLPWQNYRNWQDTIKNLFIVVTLHKLHGIENFWWFLNTNKRLEQLFGILRSMRRGDLNFDCLGFQERICDAVIISNVYSEHPEWDTNSRRLHTTVDRKNTRSWEGDTKVKDVNEVNCWSEGRLRAIRALQASQCFEFSEIDINSIKVNSPAVDMLRPFDSHISRGVLSGDRALFVLNSDEEDEDLVGDLTPPLLNEAENLMQQPQELASPEVIRNHTDETSRNSNEERDQDVIEETIVDEVEDGSDNEDVEILEEDVDVPETDMERWKSTIVIDSQGKEWNKHSLLKSLDHGGITMSSDRIFRVQSIPRHSRYQTKSKSIERESTVVERGFQFAGGEHEYSDNETYKSGDVFALLVRAKTTIDSPLRTRLAIGRAKYFGPPNLPQLECIMRKEDTDWRVSIIIDKLEHFVTTAGEFGFKSTGCTLVTLVNVDSTQLMQLTPQVEASSMDNHGEIVYHKVFTSSDLAGVLDVLKLKDNVVSAPETIFPPIQSNSRDLFVLQEREISDEIQVCILCHPPKAIGKVGDDKTTQERKCRNHMALHILEQKDELPKEPCAWCCDTGCTILVKKRNRAKYVKVNCSKFSFPDFKLSLCKSVAKFPSSQRPYYCKMCEVYIWSYNIKHHMDARHPGAPEDEYKEYLPKSNELSLLRSIVKKF